jgi:hypothetical protein
MFSSFQYAPASRFFASFAPPSGGILGQFMQLLDRRIQERLLISLIPPLFNFFFENLFVSSNVPSLTDIKN